MSIDKIKQKLIQDSIKDTTWLEEAKWRQENEDWLDISFSIAVKVASTLSANKKANVYPKSQVELAEAMGCSAQYINKLLKGQEKLQIDTICKVQRILNIKLIEVPKTVISKTVQYQPINTWIGTLNVKSPAVTTSISYSNLKIVDNYELAA